MMHLRCSPAPKSTSVGIRGEMEGKHDPPLTAHGDGSAVLLSEYATIMTDCLNICCVLYRHARRKILGLKDSVLSRAVQLPHRDHLQLAPHIFEHKCREMNYLPTTCLPDWGQNMREPVPASYSYEPATQHNTEKLH